MSQLHAAVPRTMLERLRAGPMTHFKITWMGGGSPIIVHLRGLLCAQIEQLAAHLHSKICGLGTARVKEWVLSSQGASPGGKYVSMQGSGDFC